MNSSPSFKHMLLTTSRGQLAAIAIGIVLYGTHHLFQEKLIGIPPSYANLQIYISDIFAIITICTFAFAGSRYISVRYFNSKKSTFEILKNNGLQLLLSTAFSIVVFNCVFGLTFYLNNPKHFTEDMVVTNIYGIPFIFIFYFSDYSLRAIDNYRNLLIDITRVKKEKLSAELKLLQAQFNPHFLFNAINVIYFQVQNNVDKDKSVLPHFRDMIDYLTVCPNDTVELRDEISYLKNYIEIQSQRKGDDLKLVTEFDIDNENIFIPPFVLQPFVENAFKYISGKMEMNISIKLHANILTFSVYNSIDEDLYAFQSQRMDKGIGHKNLLRRLQLTFHDKYEFNCEKIRNGYSANMKLYL